MKKLKIKTSGRCAFTELFDENDNPIENVTGFEIRANDNDGVEVKLTFGNVDLEVEIDSIVSLEFSETHKFREEAAHFEKAIKFLGRRGMINAMDEALNKHKSNLLICPKPETDEELA